MSEPVTIERKSPAAPNKEDLYGHQVRFFTQAKHDGQGIQKHLAKTHVLVFGAGAVGSYAVEALAGAGVGQIRVNDAAKVTERDVPVSALLSREDIGMTRAEALSPRVAGGSPYVSCAADSADISSAEKLGEAVRGHDCVVVCLDAAAPAALGLINEAAVRANKRLVIGQVYQGVGLVGPTVIPRQSACYKCFELRRNVNLANYDEVMQYEARLREFPGVRSDFDAPQPFAPLLGGLVALEALRLLSGAARPQTVNRVLRVNFFSTEMTYHPVLRFPTCPACGHGRRPLPQALIGK